MSIPTGGLLNRVQTILAADTGSLAAASPVKVHLAMAAFTPSLTLALASLTEATFPGYAAIASGIGTQQSFFDELTGNRVVQLLTPAAGWHWQASGTTGLPQTIYGFYVTDNASATLWGSALFGSPVNIINTGDGVDIGFVRFGIIPGAIV